MTVLGRNYQHPRLGGAAEPPPAFPSVLEGTTFICLTQAKIDCPALPFVTSHVFSVQWFLVSISQISLVLTSDSSSTLFPPGTVEFNLPVHRRKKLSTVVRLLAIPLFMLLLTLLFLCLVIYIKRSVTIVRPCIVDTILIREEYLYC